MTHERRFASSQDLNSSEKQLFDRWLSANAVIASIVAAALFACAVLAGVGTSGPEIAQAQKVTATPVANAAPAVTFERAPLVVPVADQR